jgi:hypothetical protein
MPTPLNDQQVIEACQWLERLPGERDMRDRTKGWHELFDLTAYTDLPDHVSRGDTRDTPSPFLIELLDDMQSERHAGQTSVTVIALDDTPQGTVDRIEKSLSLCAAEYMRRWRLQDEVGVHQLASYAGIAEWNYMGVKGARHYGIETPFPLQTFFPVKGGGPQRPAVSARRYQALVADIERSYAKNNGELGFDAYPTMKNDRLQWQEITDDRPPFNQGLGLNSSRFGQMVECIRYEDGAYCYHVALQPGNAKQGFMLWYDVNRSGPDENGQPASSTLVIPGGHPGAGRDPKFRLLPTLLPGIQYTHILNYITSLMATRVEQATGDVLVEKTPDMVEALGNAGKLTATAAQVNQGNPSIVEVAGKPMLWERLPLPDLQELLKFFTVERDRWSNSLREISDPQQLAQINTNVYLPHAAARRQKLKPMNDGMDWCLEQLIRFTVNALQYQNAKPLKMAARGDEQYGSKRRTAKAGESVELKWEDVQRFDERFILIVATSNLSDAELRQRMIDHDDKVQRGYATKRQGIGILFPDEDAQVMELAEDESYMAATQLLAPQVPTTVQRKLRLRGGILLPLAGAIPPPGSPAQSGGQQPYPQPMIPGPASASAPGVAPPAPAPVGA